uniref:Glutaredoxin-1 n=2 Tax=Ascaris TaxID=6251 RepID=F1L2H3_ASCSU
MGLMMSKGTSCSPEEASNVENYVDTLIATKKVVVFSKSYCPYCAKARKALMSFPLKDGALEWIEINERADCSQIQNYLMSITGARSVPRVFIGGEFFGGGDETAAAKQSGILENKLRAVAAI